MTIRKTLTVAMTLLGAASVARAQPTLTCTPDKTCYNVGESVIVTIDLAPDATTPATIVGGQFFLTFNGTSLMFVGGAPGTPWTNEIVETAGAGTLSYAVGLPADGSGTGATSGIMATLTFSATAEVCGSAGLVAFDPAHSPPTRLVDDMDVVYDHGTNLTAVDLATVTIDSTNPTTTPTTLPILTFNCTADVPTPASPIDGDVFATISGAATADNCTTTTNLVVTYTDTSMIGDPCTGIAQIQRMYVITDECGNFISPVQVILVQENVSPTFAEAVGALDVTIQCSDSTDPDVNMALGKPTPSDNCGMDATNPLSFVDNTSGLTGCNTTGTIVRVWTALDACGNTSSYIQTITVVDSTPPTFAEAAGALDATIQCSDPTDPASLGQPTPSDNCGLAATGFLTSSDDTTGLTGCNVTGTIVRTWTATDACGNSSSYIQTITVVDTTPPTFAEAAGALDATIQCSDSTDPATNPSLFVPTPSDNCGLAATGFLTSTDDTTGLTGCNGTGTILRTWTALDACGNTSTYLQTITVSDSTPPTFAEAAGALDVTVECTDPTDPASTGMPTPSDNCGMAGANPLTSSDVTNLAGCNGTGTITRSWTATDACGNTANYSQTITVVDSTPPTFAEIAGALDITIECSDSLDPDVNTTLGKPTPSDTCGLAATGSLTFSDDTTGQVGCGGTGPLVRTWTATDACGNTADYTQTITVQDTTAPTATAPGLGAAQCTSALPPAATNATEFQALPGAPTLGDNCTPLAGLVITHTDGALPSGCPGSFIRTYTIADACGNSVSVGQTIDVTDTTLPTASPPPNVAVQCTADIPVAATTQAELVLQSGAASDNCTADANLTITSADVSDGGSPIETITRTYTITDECTNAVNVVQTITVQDTLPPAASAPGATTAQCTTLLPAAATNAAEFQALPGLPTLMDNCTPVANLVFGSADGPLVGSPCGGTGTVTRTYTITDAAGNSSTVTQTINLDDTTPPVITPPADISIPADANQCQATVAVGTATATDNCDTAVAVSGTRSDGLALTDPYPGGGGGTTITWTATDACGNTGTATQTVTVTGNNALDVSIQLAGGMATGVSPDTLSRCITFVLHDCVTMPTPSPVTVEANIDFAIVDGSPTIGTATLQVPCGNYTCITARDSLHTLRRTDDDDFGTNPIPGGTTFVADFTDKSANPSPPNDNDSLIGGNFNDDGFIDIIDFGIYVNRAGDLLGMSTPCGTVPFHTNITEPALPAAPTGISYVEDYSFIMINFLQGRELNCCGAAGLVAGDGPRPRTKISVRELHGLGLADLAASDLNQDGMLDAQDIAAFLLGNYPSAPPSLTDQPGATQGAEEDEEAGSGNARRPAS